MAGDKVITLRFQEWKAIDMELYQRLEEGKKGLGLSMPSYVKSILREHFDGGEKARADASMEQIREIVHGELAAQSAALVGTLEKIAEGFPEGGVKRAGQTSGLPGNTENLPGYSDSFPDGFDGVLEKFM